MRKPWLWIMAFLIGAQPGLPNPLFEHYERKCLEKGWKKMELIVEGHRRQILWKAPPGRWKAAIVALHGGGGTCSNFGSNIPIGQPMVEFGNRALARGYAIFSPDSGHDLAPGYGKRWDCVAVSGRENVDLPFLKRVIEQTIPDCRPKGSGEKIFLTGISNGGFMAILTATHFPDRIAAFAPVSCGDPYGTYLDLTTRGRLARESAPGVFRDRGSKRDISQTGSGQGSTPQNEAPWPLNPGRVLPPFRMFQARGDGLVDLSCMEKARRQLTAHGYPDKGAFIREDDDAKRSFLEHFWMADYNQPMLDFFESVGDSPQR